MCNAERDNIKRLDILSKELDIIPEVNHEQFLKLNIGGTTFLLLIDSIRRSEPTTFLTRFYRLSHDSRVKVADAYLHASDEYYFQRSPQMFDAIFQFYATGVVHRPPEACVAAFLGELDFWHINTSFIGSCCADIIHRKETTVRGEVENVNDTTFDSLVFGKLRRRMWTFLEKPGSSTHAKGYQMLSTLFVAISVMTMSFGTIPDFQIIQYVSTQHNETVQVADGTVNLRGKS